MKYSLGISNFLEEIACLFHSVVSLYFFALISEEGFFNLSLLFFGTLHSDGNIFPFLFCFSLLFFSQLFVGPPQTAILFSCISFHGKTSAEEAEAEGFYEDLQDLLELTHIGDWNAKAGSQETPWATSKFGLRVQNEAGQRLIEFCQENALVMANTLFQQHKRRLYTWITPDGQHQN